MRRFLVFVLVGLMLGAIGVGTISLFPTQDSDTPPARRFATEQEWIQADIVSAITGMVALETPPGAGPIAVRDHVWSPATYAPLVERMLAGRQLDRPGANDVDPAVRAALMALRSETLLEQNERVSSALQQNILHAGWQESAALLVGGLALRESVGLFSDVRPALSRMAAHLAIARALRGSAEPSMDGRCALAILTALAGLERQAVQMVNDLEARAVSPADRAWVRALRVRITGDWRSPQNAGTLLERLEFARAVRGRLGVDRFWTTSIRSRRHRSRIGTASRFRMTTPSKPAVASRPTMSSSICAKLVWRGPGSTERSRSESGTSWPRSTIARGRARWRARRRAPSCRCSTGARGQRSNRGS